jgi:translation initiation factor 3 subunit I
MSGSADNSCRIWDVRTAQTKFNYVCANAVRSCGFSYSGNLIVYTTDSTLGSSCFIIIRDLRMPGKIKYFHLFLIFLSKS